MNFEFKYPGKYVVNISVKGSGPFPFEMLREDRCFPAGKEDVEDMRSTERREVILVAFSADAQPVIHEARWKSFGWDVVGIRISPLGCLGS